MKIINGNIYVFYLKTDNLPGMNVEKKAGKKSAISKSHQITIENYLNMEDIIVLFLKVIK